MIDVHVITRRVLRAYRAAPDAAREEGMGWYDAARSELEAVALLHDCSVEQAAAAAAHLSTKLRWEDNLPALRALAAGDAKPGPLLGRSWRLAGEALRSPDPLGSFGWRACKTRAFAHALCGDRYAVVVDVWAARVAGVPQRSIRSVDAYFDVATGYMRAAGRAGIAPRELQAVTWCHARGSVFLKEGGNDA